MLSSCDSSLQPIFCSHFFLSVVSLSFTLCHSLLIDADAFLFRSCPLRLCCVQYGSVLSWKMVHFVLVIHSGVFVLFSGTWVCFLGDVFSSSVKINKRISVMHA
jgi:hypothetical protein